MHGESVDKNSASAFAFKIDRSTGHGNIHVIYYSAAYCIVSRIASESPLLHFLPPYPWRYASYYQAWILFRCTVVSAQRHYGHIVTLYGAIISP